MKNKGKDHVLDPLLADKIETNPIQVLYLSFYLIGNSGIKIPGLAQLLSASL